MILNFLKSFMVNGKRKPTNFDEKIKNGSKLHTIRIDQYHRWKKNRPIHFCTGARTNKYKCFKQGVCTGTQYIIIEGRNVWVDNKLLAMHEIQDLSINDGFDSVHDFWAWFDQYSPFSGSIIHWTEMRY